MTGTFLYSWCYGDDKKVFYKYLRYWWSGLPAKILFYSFAIFLFYLFSVLLDLVEAPGAFIMGCHAQHKKQVQRVAAAMDEVIHPTMFFCSSTIEQADIETHHFLYVVKFKWCSWTALWRKYFQNNSEGIASGWSYLHSKNWWLCLQELEVSILILNSQSNSETDSQTNECQMEKSLFSF